MNDALESKINSSNLQEKTTASTQFISETTYNRNFVYRRRYMDSYKFVLSKLDMKTLKEIELSTWKYLLEIKQNGDAILIFLLEFRQTIKNNLGIVWGENAA